MWLDLGDVKNLAEVIVNGKSLGIVWKKPFRVDVTSALKPGENKVEIKVTNLWVNRLIGDAQPGVTNKITYTTMPFYQANSKLLPSGLLGPLGFYHNNNFQNAGQKTFIQNCLIKKLRHEILKILSDSAYCFRQVLMHKTQRIGNWALHCTLFIPFLFLKLLRKLIARTFIISKVLHFKKRVDY